MHVYTQYLTALHIGSMFVEKYRNKSLTQSNLSALTVKATIFDYIL